MINNTDKYFGIELKASENQIKLFNNLVENVYSPLESFSLGSFTDLPTGNDNLQTTAPERDSMGNINVYMEESKNKNKLKLGLITKRFVASSIRNSMDVDFKEFKINNTNRSRLLEISNLSTTNTELETKTKVTQNELNLVKKENEDLKKQIEENRNLVGSLISGTP